jgi:hypothetical protein
MPLRDTGMQLGKRAVDLIGRGKLKDVYVYVCILSVIDKISVI